MPRAGYCSACGTNVWLRDDGVCQNGHAAEQISQTYEAETPLPEPLTMAPPSQPKRRRRGVIIAVVAAILLVLLGICAIASFALRPLVGQGTQMASEWNARLDEDYPGWQKVGFNVRSFSGSSGAETTYSFSLIPPDRAFPVGVTYTATNGGAPVCEDDVLRPDSEFNDHADSLLDFIDETYVTQGKTVGAVMSDSDGSVTVNWQKVTKVGFFSSTVGWYDELTYDEEADSWRVSPGF
ncbi:MAG: hypothetical protein Q7U89_05255 [Coriobacteriia bacterium]|nr:hypothetical protein [Coriobacteriia bacterium]